MDYGTQVTVKTCRHLVPFAQALLKASRVREMKTVAEHLLPWLRFVCADIAFAKKESDALEYVLYSSFTGEGVSIVITSLINFYCSNQLNKLQVNT